MVGDKYEMMVSAQKKEKIKNTHNLGQFPTIVQGETAGSGQMQHHWLHICAKRRCVVSEEQVTTDDISQENTRRHTERRP